MRAAAIPGALAAASLTVPIGCGPAQQPGQGPSTNGTTARFSDVTFYVVEGEERDEVITGAFDWAKGEGWSKDKYRGASGSRLQIGADCFQQDAGEAWKHWRAEGEPPLCSDVFEPPSQVLAQLRSYGTLESLGAEDVRGLKTTHYRVVPKSESDDEPEQWLEVSLGEGDVVAKLNRPSGESSPRTREYFDFGVDVHVTPPCRPISAGSQPSTTLRHDKATLPPCVEETG